jgi:hypothetical protein
MDIVLKKERHGCVTAWLVLLIIVNAIISFIYLFRNETLQLSVSPTLIILFGLIGIANIVFAILLLSWKKIGFFGFIISSIIALILNLYAGLGTFQSIAGLFGVIILYAILSIKKDGISAWDNLFDKTKLHVKIPK